MAQGDDSYKKTLYDMLEATETRREGKVSIRPPGYYASLRQHKGSMRTLTADAKPAVGANEGAFLHQRKLSRMAARSDAALRHRSDASSTAGGASSTARALFAYKERERALKDQCVHVGKSLQRLDDLVARDGVRGDEESSARDEFGSASEGGVSGERGHHSQHQQRQRGGGGLLEDKNLAMPLLQKYGVHVTRDPVKENHNYNGPSCGPEWGAGAGMGGGVEVPAQVELAKFRDRRADQLVAYQRHLRATGKAVAQVPTSFPFRSFPYSLFPTVFILVVSFGILDPPKSPDPNPDILYIALLSRLPRCASMCACARV